MGDRKTIDQCKTLLGNRVLEFGAGVDRCVKVALPPARKAALTSFAYNVGITAMCRSSIVKKLNTGDIQGGCDAFRLYVKAGDVVLRGLVKRREEERRLCLETE